MSQINPEGKGVLFRVEIQPKQEGEKKSIAYAVFQGAIANEQAVKQAAYEKVQGKNLKGRVVYITPKEVEAAKGKASEQAQHVQRVLQPQTYKTSSGLIDTLVAFFSYIAKLISPTGQNILSKQMGEKLQGSSHESALEQLRIASDLTVFDQTERDFLNGAYSLGKELADVGQSHAEQNKLAQGLRQKILENKTVAIPVGFGEGDRYAPGILLFQDHGKKLTIFSLASKGEEGQVTSTTEIALESQDPPLASVLDTVLLGVIQAQPRQTKKSPEGLRPSQETDSISNLTSLVINKAEKAGLKNIELNKSQERVQTSQDPLKLFLNLVNHRRKGQQLAPLSKIDFFQSYVDVLLKTVKENPYLLSQKEKDQILIRAKTRALDLRIQIENSLELEEGMSGPEIKVTARRIVAPLLLHLDEHIEEQETATSRGIQSREALDKPAPALISLKEANLPDSISGKEIQAKGLEITALNLEQQEMIQAIRQTVESKKPQEVESKMLQEVTSTKLNAVVEEADRLIEAGKFRQAKRLTMEAMRALPPPGNEAWDKLTGEELGKVHQSLSEMSKLFGEAHIKIGEITMTPEEALEYNVVYTTILIQLTDKIIKEKSAEFERRQTGNLEDQELLNEVKKEENNELRELYTYAFYLKVQDGLANYLRRGRQVEKEIRMMTNDPTLLTGADPHLEARVRAARKFQDNGVLFKFQRRQNPDHKKFEEIKKKLGEEEISSINETNYGRHHDGIFNTEAEGHRWLVPPEMKELTRHVMLVRVFEQPKKALGHYNSDLGGALFNLVTPDTKNPLEEIKKMKRVRLTAVEHRRALREETAFYKTADEGGTFGFSTEENGGKVKFHIKTNVSAIPNSNYKPLDFSSNSEGRTPLLGEVPKSWVPPPMIPVGEEESEYDPLQKGGSLGVMENVTFEMVERAPQTNLPPDIEYNLLTLLQLKKEIRVGPNPMFSVHSNSTGNVRMYQPQPISVKNAMLFALEHPELLNEQVVRDRLYMILLQPGLMQKAMKQDGAFFEGQQEKIEALLKDPELSLEGKIFLEDMVRQLNAVAKEMQKTNLVEKLPVIDVKKIQIEYEAGKSKTAHKQHAYRLLAAFRAKGLAEVTTPRELYQLYSALLILKNSPVEGNHPIMEKSVFAWAERELIPKIEKKLEEDETFRNTFVGLVANKPGTWEPVQEERLAFEMKGQKINLLNLEGISLEFEASRDKQKLPIAVLQDPGFRKVFGTSFRPLANVHQQTGKIEYRFNHEDRVFVARVATKTGEVQLIQMRKGKEMIYVDKPGKVEDPIHLVRHAKELMAGGMGQNALDALIEKHGIWVSKKQAFVAMENQDLGKKVIVLERGSRGAISNAKLGKRVMVRPPSALPFPVSPDRALFFADSSGGRVKEIFLLDKGVSLVRSEDQWHLKGPMSDWVWDTWNNVGFEREFGKGYRRWMLPFFNKNTQAREFWIWPNQAIGSGKRGEEPVFNATSNQPIVMRESAPPLKKLSGPPEGYLYLAYVAASEGKWGKALSLVQQVNQMTISEGNKAGLIRVAQLLHRNLPSTTRQAAFALKLHLELRKLERRPIFSEGELTRPKEELQSSASHYLANEKSHLSRLKSEGLLINNQDWSALQDKDELGPIQAKNFDPEIEALSRGADVGQISVSSSKIVDMLLDLGGVGMNPDQSLDQVRKEQGHYPHQGLVVNKFYPLLLEILEKGKESSAYQALLLEGENTPQVTYATKALLQFYEQFQKLDAATQNEVKAYLKDVVIPKMRLLEEMQALLTHEGKPLQIPFSMLVSHLPAVSLVPLLGPSPFKLFAFASLKKKLGFKDAEEMQAFFQNPLRLIQGDFNSNDLFPTSQERIEFMEKVSKNEKYENPTSIQEIMTNRALRLIEEKAELREDLTKLGSALKQYAILVIPDTEEDLLTRAFSRIPEAKQNAMNQIQELYELPKPFPNEKAAIQFVQSKQNKLIGRLGLQEIKPQEAQPALPEIQILEEEFLEIEKQDLPAPPSGPIRLSDFKPTRPIEGDQTNWEEEFFDSSTLGTDKWGSQVRQGYFQSTPGQTPKMEEALNKEITEGLSEQNESWEGKYAHSLKMSRVQKLHKALKKNIYAAKKERSERKQRIYELARLHADKLGIQGDLSYLTTVSERRLMGRLLELYRDGKIDRLAAQENESAKSTNISDQEEKANQAAKDLNELAQQLGEYAAFSIQLHQFIEAGRLTEEMMENKNQLIAPDKLIPIGIGQQDANRAKNWLLKSQRLHEILTKGANLNRYEAPQDLRDEIIQLAKQHQETLGIQENLDKLTPVQQKAEIRKLLEMHRKGEIQTKLNEQAKSLIDKLEEYAPFTEEKKRLYRFVEVQNAWYNRDLSLEAVEKLMKSLGPNALVPLQTGAGKTSFVFPSVAHLALLGGKVPIMVTTRTLVRQFRSKLDPRAFLLEYDFTKPKSLEEMQEIATVLKNLKKEGRYVVTSDETLIALKQRWVDLHQKIGEESFKEIEVLNEINRAMQGEEVVFFGDEDIILDVGYSDNVALGAKGPVETPVRVVGKALAEGLWAKKEFQPFLLKGELNKVRNFEVELKEHLHNLLQEPTDGEKKGFMEKIGWDPITETGKRDELVEYLLDKNKTRPEFIGNFDSQQPKYKNLAILRRMLTSTMTDVQGTNSALMRGYSGRDGYSVVPLTNSKYIEGMSYAGEDELALHSYLQYMSNERQMGEKAFLKEFNLLKKRSITDATGKSGNFVASIEREAQAMSREEKREVSNYEAFTKSPKLVQERLDFAEFLLEDGKIGKRKKQISFLRPEGFLTGGKGKVASATGDRYEQAMVNSQGFFDEKDVPNVTQPDLLSGDTLLKVNTETAVRSLSKDPFDNLVSLAKDKKAMAMVNLDFDILGNKGEVIARELAKKVPGRQYIYRQSGTLAPMILNGPGAKPIPYRPGLVDASRVFFILNPDDSTGVDFPIPPGEVHVFHDQGSEFYRARQGYGRARKLFQGQEVIPWASQEFINKIKVENNNPKQVKMGHLLNSLKKQTVEDRKTRHVKALHFHVENPIKGAFSNALRREIRKPESQEEEKQAALAQKELMNHLEGFFFQTSSIDYEAEFGMMEAKGALVYAKDLYQKQLDKLKQDQIRFNNNEVLQEILQNQEHPAYARVKAVEEQYEKLIGSEAKDGYEQLLKNYADAAQENPVTQIGQAIRAYHLANLPEMISGAPGGEQTKVMEKAQEQRKVQQKSKSLQQVQQRRRQKVGEKQTEVFSSPLPQFSMALTIEMMTNENSTVDPEDAQLHKVQEGVFITTKAQALLKKAPNRTTPLVHQMLIRNHEGKTNVIFLTRGEWGNEVEPFLLTANRLQGRPSGWSYLGWRGGSKEHVVKRGPVQKGKARPEIFKKQIHLQPGQEEDPEFFVSFEQGLWDRRNELQEEKLMPARAYSKIVELARNEGLQPPNFLKGLTRNPPAMEIQTVGLNGQASSTVSALKPNKASEKTYGNVAMDQETLERIAIGKLAMGTLAFSQQEWNALIDWAKTLDEGSLQSAERRIGAAEIRGQQGSLFLRQLVYAIHSNPELLPGKQGTAIERLKALRHEQRVNVMNEIKPVPIPEPEILIEETE